MKIFKKRGLAVGQVGQITNTKQVVLTLKDQSGIFIDLNKESMFGLPR